MTDVLGTCLSWTDRACVVQPEDGPPVTIALADIVSGKPVPPRPSPRLRVSPADAQRRGMTLFPDLVTEPLGAWTLRRSETYAARRANSVLAMEPSGRADAYERVVAFYEGYGARPVAAVVRDSPEEAIFTGHGWVAESHEADTSFQLASVASVARRLSAPRVEVTLDVAGDLATASVGDRATGVAVLDGDWVGYRSIAVDASARRQGLALAVMTALVEWSAERGATTAYLQVLADNDPALALYAGLGFVKHHVYRYLAPPR
jgi:N-acetylglutamate synthase